MQRTTILALCILSFGSLLPIACTQDFNFYQSTMGAGGTSGSSSSASTHSSSSSGGLGCKMDSDCTPTSPCKTDTCNTSTGKCVEASIPDGPVPGLMDTTKDCKTDKCVGGVQTTVDDNADVPDNTNVCVTLSCSMQKVVTNNAMAGTSCGGTQKCDGQGNCVGCNMNSDCPDPGPCKTVACDKPNHKCVISPASQGTGCNSGGGKVCDAGGNCVGCNNNGDCPSGNCTGNKTCGLAMDGHPCGANGECISTHCANGVCCDHTCKNTCQACTAALTGNQDGTCDNVKAGTAPVPANQCTAATCANNGKCDGNGGCDQVAQGAMCGPSSCVGNTFHGAQTCNGAMMCTGNTQDCMTYKCGALGCPTSCQMNGDADCSTGNYCKTSNHTCVSQLPVGSACTANDQCLAPATCQAVDGGMTCM